MKKLHTSGPLAGMLDNYDHAIDALREAQCDVELAKRELIEFAVDHKLYDCLTVNATKLRREVH